LQLRRSLNRLQIVGQGRCRVQMNHPSERSRLKVPPVGEEGRHFRDLLHGQGQRMTPEREIILAEIFQIEGHFQPDDLLVRFRTNGVRISRATIYRTLDLLVSCGLVRRETFGGGAHYERAHHVEGHSHQITGLCAECRKRTPRPDGRS
jgi:Fe2+ or Zn2+ uptake regulation protein